MSASQKTVHNGSVEATPLLMDLRGISKRFGAVQALKSVDLSLREGEVHALLGENGAGKSTLIKILAGVHKADAGEINLFGEQWLSQSAADIRDAGVSVVYQELSLVPTMTVADNLVLGREKRSKLGTVSPRRVRNEVRAFLDDLGVDLDPNAVVETLPFAYRQMTEICKALLGDVRILVLDEPTSALTADEEKVLFSAVQKVTATGVGVIYVTHRLDEVFRLTDRVTVLRDGVSAATLNTADTTMEQLVREIVGGESSGLAAEIEELEGSADTSSAATRQEAVVDLENVDGTGSRSPLDGVEVLTLDDVRNSRLHGVTLSVRAGEIHGLAGLVGSGQSDILETVFGLRPVRSGQMTIAGRACQFKRTLDGIRAGVALVPGDRHLQGLVLDKSIEWNVGLPEVARSWAAKWLDLKGIRAKALRAKDVFRIKTPSIKGSVQTLSGGNQQKVVFGKWADPVPTVLLLDEPTAGVDVGARKEIYRIIHEIAANGAAVIVSSSDLIELLLLSDRISVVRRGRITQTLDRQDVEGREALHLLLQEEEEEQPVETVPRDVPGGGAQ